MKNTNTRVDALDAHVTSLATELGMIQNGEIVDTNTRVDSLESRMDAVDGISGALATLDFRLDTAENDIDTLESDLNTAETGLKARMTAAESRLTATESKANAAATASDLSNLADRVSSLENEPKSATTIIPEDRITYDSETGAPTIYTTSAKTVPLLHLQMQNIYQLNIINTIIGNIQIVNGN